MVEQILLPLKPLVAAERLVHGQERVVNVHNQEDAPGAELVGKLCNGGRDVAKIIRGDDLAGL